MLLLDKAFSLKSSLSETEESKFHYTSGYVAFEENFGVAEWTDLQKIFQAHNLLFYYLVVSYRIHLLIFFNCPVFCIFITKTRRNLVLTVCYKHFTKFTNPHNLRKNKILRLFVNCFSKAHALHVSDKSANETKK